MQFHIQYLSDVHLEFSRGIQINKHSSNLALCGDIGYPGTTKYSNFILYCSELFQNVFVVFGNHEYYHTNFDHIETMDEKKRLTSTFPSNVYFLDDKCIFIHVPTNKVSFTAPKQKCKEYVKLIGSTFWTAIDIQTFLNINDSNFIFTGKNSIRLDHNMYRAMHNKALQYVIRELDAQQEISSVLLTHHPVHPICFGTNRPMNLHSAYVTSCPELYKRKNLKACISGHTHSSLETSVEFDGHNIEFLSNPVGYRMEKNVIKYTDNCVYSLSLD